MSFGSHTGMPLFKISELIVSSKLCAYRRRHSKGAESKSLVWRYTPTERCTVEHPKAIVWNIVYLTPYIDPLLESGEIVPVFTYKKDSVDHSSIESM